MYIFQKKKKQDNQPGSSSTFTETRDDNPWDFNMLNGIELEQVTSET